MRWKILLGTQAAIVTAGLFVITLWPASGEPAVLVPIMGQSAQSQWSWVAAERARLVSYDTANARLTVLAPSQASLFRAIGSGYLPLAAAPSGCLAGTAEPAR